MSTSLPTFISADEPPDDISEPDDESVPSSSPDPPNNSTVFAVALVVATGLVIVGLFAGVIPPTFLVVSTAECVVVPADILLAGVAVFEQLLCLK